MAILPSGFSSPNQGLFRHVPCGFQLFCWSFHPPICKATNSCDNNIDCTKKCFMVCLYFTLLFRVTFSDVMEISPPKSLKKEKLWRKSRQKKKKKQHTCWYGNQTVNDCNFSLLLKFHKPPSFPKGRLPPREGHFARPALYHCSSFAVEQKSTALDAKCPKSKTQQDHYAISFHWVPRGLLKKRLRQHVLWSLQPRDGVDATPPQSTGFLNF